MNVSMILDNKGSDVICIPRSASAMEAAKALTSNRIGAVPVMDGAELLGIVSERDLINAVASKGYDGLDCPVTDLMTQAVVCCGKDSTVDHLMTMMTERRIRHVPVKDGDKLIGIVSIGDVVKNRLMETEQEAEALKTYIATG